MYGGIHCMFLAVVQLNIRWNGIGHLLGEVMIKLEYISIKLFVCA